MMFGDRIAPHCCRALSTYALFAVAGCGSATSAEGAGTVLTLRGSAKLSAEAQTHAAGQALRPALAFGLGKTQLRLVHGAVSGQLPGAFELTTQRPPPEVLETLPELVQRGVGPLQLAAAYIAAVPGDTPRERPLVRRSEYYVRNLSASEHAYTLHRTTRVAGDCLTWLYACDTDGAPVEQCAAMGTQGDPEVEALAQRVAADFAGFSADHMVWYFDRDVPAGTFPARLFNAATTGLGAGYHLFEVHEPSMEEEQAREDCERLAEQRATDQLNQQYGTQHDRDYYRWSQVTTCVNDDECMLTELGREWREVALRERDEMMCPSFDDLVFRELSAAETQSLSLNIGLDVPPSL